MRDPKVIAARTLTRFRQQLISTESDQFKDKVGAFRERAYGSASYLVDSEFNDWLFGSGVAASTCALSDNQVVGQQCSRPLSLSYNGNQVNVANAFNLYVEPDWKLKGLGVALTTELTERYDVIVCQGISDEAYAMYKRLNWCDLGMLDYFLCPLKLNSVRRKEEESIRRCSVKLLFYYLSHLWRWIMSVTGKPAELVHADCITDKHAGLINQCSGRRIHLHAEAHYLNWLYRHSVYKIWNAKSDGGDALFVIRQHYTETGLQWLICECSWQNEAVVHPAFRALLKQAQQSEVDSLVFHGKDDRLLIYLRLWGFVARDNGARFMCYCGDESLKPMFEKPENWRCTTNISDLDFSDVFSKQSRKNQASLAGC